MERRAKPNIPTAPNLLKPAITEEKEQIKDAREKTEIIL